MFEKPGWSFPSNSDGQEAGLNDPGIEMFKKDPLESLARECLQNSADAVAGKKPVDVRFERFLVDKSQFPGFEEFAKTLQACRRYGHSSPKTAAFFDEALAVLRRPGIPVLKISDHNTTGLTIGGENDRTSDWFKLTKSVGISDKNDGKLGSFGIGKHAPFACSDLRTVFYGTKDQTGAEAFQGVAKLVTHIGEKKARTQGTGYWGWKKGNRPLAGFEKVDSKFGRKRIGADIYVAGFHDYPDWEARIAKAVIESFLVAIHEGKLTVRVGSTILNATSLEEQIKKQYAERKPEFYADAYYKALTSSESQRFEEEDFCGKGKLTLHIAESKEFKTKVAIFRHSGMKIFDKKHFRTPLNLAGVLTIGGDRLDALLRTLENPNHNAWEDERGNSEARQIKDKLLDWVRDKIRELSASGNPAEVDAEGVSQFLPDNAVERGKEEYVERLSEEPAEKIEMFVRKTKLAKVLSTAVDAATRGEGEEEGEEEWPEPGEDGGGGRAAFSVVRSARMPETATKRKAASRLRSPTSASFARMPKPAGIDCCSKQPREGSCT